MKAIAERLWSRVSVGAPDECWPWTGATTRGYGAISRGSRGAGMVGTHRVAYESAHGSADGVHIRHTCDNPICCNPGHLIPGTHDDNMRDMAERGRSRTRRLTPEEVVAIRRRASEGQRQRDLAAVYGVRQSNISAIVRRETWRHVA